MIVIEVWDPEHAAAKGEPGQIALNFQGITIAQARVATTYLQSITRKLDEFITKETEMQKFGDKEQGRIIPESDDDQKTAAKTFTAEDRAALQQENADTDGT
jgi:hypothetical protein